MHHMFFGFLFIGLFHRLIGKLFMLVLIVAVVLLFLKWQQERARNGPRGWN
jgi:4-hydroxybenzoate polyprenyltransferase